jgi:Protein of unknown function (DUF3102)
MPRKPISRTQLPDKGFPSKPYKVPVSINSDKIYLPQIIPFKTRASYAAEIVRAWQHSVDSIITVGRLIAEAKAELRHGEFSAMIRADLPFGPRTARRLMAVAQHPVIAKGTHASVLPPSWTTLYELTRLPEETLEAKIAEGVIHAGIERKDVAALRRQLDPVPAGQREHSQNSVNHREAAPAAKALVDRMLALFRGGTADQRCDIVFELWCDLSDDDRLKVLARIYRRRV